MADFVQMMKDWRRMCEHYNRCVDCPMSEKQKCISPYHNEWKMDFSIAEAMIKEWAAEHPEPVYETWLEFIKRYETGKPKSDDDFIYWMAITPIPAEIAQKLGIQPKEDI